jgi:hypothetical protein
VSPPRHGAVIHGHEPYLTGLPVYLEQLVALACGLKGRGCAMRLGHVDVVAVGGEAAVSVDDIGGSLGSVLGGIVTESTFIHEQSLPRTPIPESHKPITHAPELVHTPLDPHPMVPPAEAPH